MWLRWRPIRLEPVLKHWGIHRFSVPRTLRGSYSSNWVIESAGRLHVLRRVVDDEEYVEYQVRLIEHLGASGFPYEVPHLVTPKRSSTPYVTAEGAFWMLYPFIEGEEHSAPSDARRARDVGKLVAHYTRAVEDFDPGPSAAEFALELFDRDGTRARLSAVANDLATGSGLPDLSRVLAERIDTLLAGYGAIPDADLARVRELPRSTIYNDWTTGNHLVDPEGTVCGLIDFDSVIEAPRIVDFQNALAYVLLGAPPGQETGLVSAFAQGYLTVLAPPPEELALVHPVALDRIAELIVRRVAAAHREPIRHREVLAIRFIELFCWLSEDRTRLAHGYTF